MNAWRITSTLKDVMTATTAVMSVSIFFDLIRYGAATAAMPNATTAHHRRRTTMSIATISARPSSDARDSELTVTNAPAASAIVVMTLRLAPVLQSA